MIVLPVIREFIFQQSAFVNSLLIDPCSRKRSKDTQLHNINTAVFDIFVTINDILFRIRVKAKNKSTKRCNMMLMHLFYNLFIKFYAPFQIAPLTNGFKSIRFFRFKSGKNHVATTLIRPFKHFIIINNIKRTLTKPGFLNSSFHHSLKQGYSTFLSILTIINDMVIYKKQLWIFIIFFYFIQHLVNGSFSVFSSIEQSDRTEITIHRTPPGSLNRGTLIF